MSSKNVSEIFHCEHFTWRLYRRDGVFYADGRGAAVSLRRKSLGTRNRETALRHLKELDKRKAMDLGMIPREGMATSGAGAVLSIEQGLAVYQGHLNRPEAAKGVRDSTRKRYRSVVRHFKEFCQAKGIGSWNGVDSRMLSEFGRKLEEEDYKPRSVYLEMTTIKQISKYLVENKHLPASCAFRYPMSKPTGTDTHCYLVEEVLAILELAKSLPGQEWMYRALVGLAYTGLRVSELASLRWSDFNDELTLIRLTDQGHRSRHEAGRRRTKTGRSRSLPVHEDLRLLLLSMSRDPSRPVFPSALGKRLNCGRLRDQFVRLVIRPLSARFPTPEGERGFADGRLHSFRHFFCSRMVNQGVHLLTLQKWLGHKNSQMVAHYFDLKDAEATAVMASIEMLPKTEPAGGNG
ncbi:MAG: tyrosine-type recombinase/integrase [Planctomycetaceae bacterium]